jgi:hypothetical protein
MVPTSSLNIMSFDVSMLILKVQQCPQLEAGVRHGDLYAVIAGLLSSLSQEGVFIDIENTPGAIVFQIFIFAALSRLFRGLLEIDSSFN